MSETQPNGPAILDELDAADMKLRRIYEELARDPDLAPTCADEIVVLTERRLELARQVGLAALAARRRADAARNDLSSTHVAEPPPASTHSTSNVVDDSSPVAVEDTSGASSPTAPAAESRPASPGDVAAWTQRIQENGLGRLRTEHLETLHWECVLDDLMKTVGAPRGAEEIWEDVEALDVISGAPHVAQWSQLPREMQRLWLSMLVARTRALREHAGDVDLQMRVKAVISRYPGWAKEYAPGHVNGLQARHTPIGGSWAADARALWSEIEALLAAAPEPTQPSRPTRSAKKAKETPRPATELDEAFEASSAMAQSTRGRKVLMVGGDPREPNRARLERAFAFASLEWPDAEGPRAANAVAGRIRGGSYDMVIVLQPFVDHSLAEAVIAAAKDAGVRWVLAQGYGIPAVKLGLERFLGARAQLNRVDA